jgi:hypothetical protein
LNIINILKRFWPLLIIVIIVVLAAIILPSVAGLMPHISRPETIVYYFTRLTLDSPSINIPDDVKEGEPFEISGHLYQLDEAYVEQFAGLVEKEVSETGWVSTETLETLFDASLIPADALTPLPSRKIMVFTTYSAKPYNDTQTVVTDKDGYFKATIQIDNISQWSKYIVASYEGEERLDTRKISVKGSEFSFAPIQIVYIPSYDYIPDRGYGPVRVPGVKDTSVQGRLSNVSIISIVSYLFVSIFVAIVAYFIYRYHKKLRAWLKRRKAKVTVQEPASTETSLLSPKVIREISTGDPRVDISFPQIENQLPLVWGIGEPLTILSRPLVETPENDIKSSPQIRATDHSIDISMTDFVPVQLEHSFDRKGETDINVYFGGDTNDKMFGNRKIKIVDYREEIVELFNRLIDSLSAKGIDVDRMMTAREIESKLTDKHLDFSPNTMKYIVKGFEYANYSLHPVARKVYVDMYLAVETIEERIKNA